MVMSGRARSCSSGSSSTRGHGFCGFCGEDDLDLLVFLSLFAFLSLFVFFSMLGLFSVLAFLSDLEFLRLAGMVIVKLFGLLETT